MIRNRERALLTAAIVLVAMVAGGCRRAPAEQPPRRPNILFILLDDLRCRHARLRRHPYVKTPQIDRIANEGVNFKNAFCTTSLCSPSRASLLSGVYAHKHGVTNNFTEFPAGDEQFSQGAAAGGLCHGLRRQVPHGRGQRRAEAGLRLLRHAQGPGQIFRHRVQLQRRAARDRGPATTRRSSPTSPSTGCSAITPASPG